MRTRTTWSAIAVAASVMALTTGCLSSSGSGDDNTSGGDSTGGSSSTVELMLGFSGAQLENFKASLDPWAEEQGITIKWSPSDNFNQLINTRAQANDLPDIAMFPQPGVLKDLVAKNKVTALDDVLDMDDVESNFTAGTLDVGSVDGKLYGLIVSMNVKSLVFYPKKAWDAAGYEVPESLDDLAKLADQIKADGTAPWCLGIESGPATGWPATDWLEDLVLKYGGIDEYNKWVAGDVKFSSDLVKQAANEFASLTFETDGNVFGGRSSIASNNFGTAGNPMFNDPAQCYLYKMGNFIAASGFFPDEILADTDDNIGVFGFPPAEAGGDNPVLGGGDLAAILKPSDAASKVLQYMSSKDFGAEAAKAGTFISPRTDFDTSNYPSELTKSIAQVAYDTTAFAFDGSDQMPGAVGSGTFWTEMTSWIAGTEDLDTALANIDASWPTS